MNTEVETENEVVAINGNYYTRQEPLRAKDKIEGSDDNEAFFALQEQGTPVQYVVIEASKLIPSHLGNVENPMHHWLKKAQPRNRAMSQSGALTPVLIAENLRPAEITEGSSAYSGAPIVNSRGEVIQGNGRAYALIAYWKTFGDSDPKKYRDFLVRKAHTWGFAKNDVTKILNMNAPVLVRVADVSDDEAIRLGQFQMKDSEALSKESGNTKARINRIGASVLAKIIQSFVRISDANPEYTLAEIIRESNVLSVLVDKGVLRQDEANEIYATEGTINAKGVQFITDFFLNIVFQCGEVSTSEQFLELPHQFKEGFKKSLLYILQIPPKASIHTEITQSITAYYAFSKSSFFANMEGANKRQKSTALHSWTTQFDTFGSTPIQRYGRLAIALLQEYLGSNQQKDIVYIFKKYLDKVKGVPATMFSPAEKPLNKETAVKELWNININAEPDQPICAYINVVDDEETPKDSAAKKTAHIYELTSPFETVEDYPQGFLQHEKNASQFGVLYYRQAISEKDRVIHGLIPLYHSIEIPYDQWLNRLENKGYYDNLDREVQKAAQLDRPQAIEQIANFVSNFSLGEGNWEFSFGKFSEKAIAEKVYEQMIDSLSNITIDEVIAKLKIELLLSDEIPLPPDDLKRNGLNIKRRG